VEIRVGKAGIFMVWQALGERTGGGGRAAGEVETWWISM